MAIFSKCSWCGKRMPHTCFRGGTRVAIGFTEKDLKRAAEQMVYNEIQGKTGNARFKGVPAELKPMLQFEGGNIKAVVEQARRDVQKKRG